MTTVGFDLDLTLVDARPGIAATCRALSERTRVHIDADAMVARIGIPLAEEFARWFPARDIQAAVRTYRELYPKLAISSSRLMPGAAAAVTAARSHGLRVVVVTAKLATLASLHLDHLGLAVDEVIGDQFGAGKTRAITGTGVGIYVGDHVADMAAARTAGVTAVGVTTGGHSRHELAAAGADAVLSTLDEFPSWLTLPRQLTPPQ